MGEVRTRRLVAASMVMLLVLLIPVSAEETGTVRLEIDALDDNASKVKIKNAFIKQMSNRGMSRPLVTRITEMIA